jgi:hypothetical protein
MSSRPPADAKPLPHAGMWRILLVFLLVLAAMTGLRGAITAPKWDGPLHRDGLAIAAALEGVIAALLAVTVLRFLGHRGVTEGELPAKLRLVLVWVLSLGLVPIAVLMIIDLHLHYFTRKTLVPFPRQSGVPKQTPGPTKPAKPSPGYVIPLSIILYGLLALLLMAVIVLAVRYRERLRPAGPFAEEIAEDSPDAEDLREAVTSGREALLTIDDARAAIIACYLAMERSLAERGAARSDADTPDELLARAAAAGLITGPAASRLTGLFYQARFSPHPMDQGQRAAAEQALSELADEAGASR